jgi:hypothetical protein
MLSTYRVPPSTFVTECVQMSERKNFSRLVSMIGAAQTNSPPRGERFTTMFSR